MSEHKIVRFDERVAGIAGLKLSDRIRLSILELGKSPAVRSGVVFRVFLHQLAC